MYIPPRKITPPPRNVFQKNSLNPKFEEKFLNKEAQKIYFNTKHVHTSKKNHVASKNVFQKSSLNSNFEPPRKITPLPENVFQKICLNPNFEEKFLNSNQVVRWNEVRNVRKLWIISRQFILTRNMCFVGGSTKFSDRRRVTQ